MIGGGERKQNSWLPSKRQAEIVFKGALKVPFTRG